MRNKSSGNVSVASYQNDPLYPRIVCAVAVLLEKGKVVAPVDVLAGMGLLAPEHLDGWRRGRIPYLEQAIDCNLARLSRLLRILRFHAHDLKLVPSETAYVRYGSRQRLRFTKTGDARLEQAYARHFIWPGKGPFWSPQAGCIADVTWRGTISVILPRTGCGKEQSNVRRRRRDDHRAAAR